MRTRKQFLAIPLVLAVIAGLGACMDQRAGQASPNPNASAASARPASSVGPAAGSGVTRAQGAPAVAAQAADQAAVKASAIPPLPPLDRMVIKNATLGISVEDPETTLGDVDRLVQAQQGLIVNQTVRTQEDKTFVNLAIQVPQERFEDTLDKLRSMRAHGSRVLTDTVSGQDVTDQFVDLDAQYRNLQATRDAYQKLLDKATAVSDIVTLTREVANIQTQMDQIKGRQNVLQHQSAKSTINLALSPVGAAPGPSLRLLPKPLQAAQEAWLALLTGLQGLAVVLIWMAILLPLPALVLGLGWVVYRRATRTRASAYQAEGTRS
jgi:hypothetical protein